MARDRKGYLARLERALAELDNDDIALNRKLAEANKYLTPEAKALWLSAISRAEARVHRSRE